MTALDQPAAAQSQKAVLWVTFGMIMFSIQDTVIKWVSGTYPLHEVVLYRSIFGLALTLAFVYWEGGFGLLKTRRLPLHLTRGLLLVITNSAYFAALATMQLAETMAIFFIAPLIITALSVPLQGEHVGWRRWLAILTGMIGVLLIVKPSSDAFNAIAFLPALAALGYALTQLMTRPLGKTDSASAMSFYIQATFLGFSALVGLTIGDGRFSGSGSANIEFLTRAWLWPTPVDLSLFAISGFIVAIGGIAISQAYRMASPTVVAPFEYLALPFAVLWGVLLWGEVPDALAFAGIGLIVTAGLFTIYRERVTNKPISSAKSQIGKL